MTYSLIIADWPRTGPSQQWNASKGAPGHYTPPGPLRQALGIVTVLVGCGQHRCPELFFSQQGKQDRLQPGQLHAGRQPVGLGPWISIDLFLQELQEAVHLCPGYRQPRGLSGITSELAPWWLRLRWERERFSSLHCGCCSAVFPILWVHLSKASSQRMDFFKLLKSYWLPRLPFFCHVTLSEPPRVSQSKMKDAGGCYHACFYNTLHFYCFFSFWLIIVDLFYFILFRGQWWELHLGALHSF